MTLEEAIKEHEYIVDHNKLRRGTRSIEAQRLGIEALKWRKLMEADYGSWVGPPLPGETEETPRRAHFHQPALVDKDKRGT